jgi:hypothetical protein
MLLCKRRCLLVPHPAGVVGAASFGTVVGVGSRGNHTVASSMSVAPDYFGRLSMCLMNRGKQSFCWVFLLAFTARPISAATFDAGPPWRAPITKGLVELPSGTLLATRVGPRDGQTVAFAVSSDNGGQDWKELGEFDRSVLPDTDLGDAHLIIVPDKNGSSEVLCSYRFNVRRDDGVPTYSIRVVASKDGGETWAKPSIVAQSEGVGHGLWASFLHHTAKGVLQCYYDDEDTPNNRAFRGHSWITMRSFDSKTGRWENPVTVSRTNNSDNLARDGMCSVCELTDTHYLCVFESVSATRRTPDNKYPATIRMVESKNAGASWNWPEGRQVVYEPPGLFMAFSPWAIRLGSGDVLCVFATDEDRQEAGVPGMNIKDGNMDLKCVSYDKESRHWSRPNVVHAEGHKDYMPVIIPLLHGPDSGRFLLQYLDFASTPPQFMLMKGDIKEVDGPAVDAWGLWPETPGKWVHQSGTQQPLEIECLGNGSVMTAGNHAGVTWEWNRRPDKKNPTKAPGRFSINWPDSRAPNGKFWRDEIMIDRGAETYSGQSKAGGIPAKGVRPK